MKAQITTGSVHIDPEAIPDAEYETACKVLDGSVRLLFRQPGIDKEYAEFLKGYKPPERRPAHGKQKAQTAV